MSSDQSNSAAKQAKQLNDLADADLAEVFKNLPPYDRLRAAEVCTRWYDISRKTWLDRTQLSLNAVPFRFVGAILRKCPNLTTVICEKQALLLNDLNKVSAEKLKSVRLYNSTFVFYRYADGARGNRFLTSDLPVVAQRELVLHGQRMLFEFLFDAIEKPLYAPVLLHASLTHLQLSGLDMTDPTPTRHLEVRDLYRGLRELSNLECLIVHFAKYYNFGHNETSGMWQALAMLDNLRELYLGGCTLWSRVNMVPVIAAFPRLEVLFLEEYMRPDSMVHLLTKVPSLRILVLAGSFSADGEILIPVRELYPKGFGNNPMPLLHVFLGRWASQLLRFTLSDAETAKFYPINRPFYLFLLLPEIKPIFEGVWIAQMLIECAKRGIKWWDYPQDIGKPVLFAASQNQDG